MDTSFIRKTEKDMLQFINVEAYSTLLWDVNLDTGEVSGTGYGYLRERGIFDSKVISPSYALNNMAGSYVDAMIKDKKEITIIAQRSPDSGGFNYSIF